MALILSGYPFLFFQFPGAAYRLSRRRYAKRSFLFANQQGRGFKTVTSILFRCILPPLNALMARCADDVVIRVLK
jgi:hypothetical protein